jgi:hypothetical protein
MLIWSSRIINWLWPSGHGSPRQSNGVVGKSNTGIGECFPYSDKIVWMQSVLAVLKRTNSLERNARNFGEVLLGPSKYRPGTAGFLLIA